MAGVMVVAKVVEAQEAMEVDQVGEQAEDSWVEAEPVVGLLAAGTAVVAVRVATVEAMGRSLDRDTSTAGRVDSSSAHPVISVQKLRRFSTE